MHAINIHTSIWNLSTLELCFIVVKRGKHQIIVTTVVHVI